MENDKRQNLINSLSETELIISTFEKALKQDWSEPECTHDFSAVADRILTPVRKVEKPQEKVAVHKLNSYSGNLESLKGEVAICQKCKLCKTRKNVVFGEGCTVKPLVMIIGEGPGENEDLTGRPFVGKAGEYLDAWLKSISLSRQKNTYIANIVKCRPPQNRDPESDEKKACVGYLKTQIELLQPKVILCLGKPASTLMTGIEDAPMGTIRGKFFFYNRSIPMICTYHPAAVLRDLSLKRAVWEDLKKLATFLNLEIVTKS